MKAHGSADRAGRAALSIACLAATLVSGCTRASMIEGRIDGLRDIVDQAERNGAYRCSPRELALARANLRFAEAELGQGNAARAEDHLVIAEPNAHAALTLSPPARCAPRDVVVAERPAEPPPPGDRDADGYLDPDDGCPDEAEDFDGFEDADGCPDDQDTDGDGLSDTRDICPVEAEDVDGYLDTDGCPEPDNDLDRIADANDRCANEPEDLDGFQDEDGCPDRDNDTDGLPDVTDRCPNEAGPQANEGCPRVYEDVEVTGTHIRIRQTVYFRTNRAIIQPRSYAILDTVAQVLRDYPTIKLEVQGHTDDRGRDSYNLRLSQERADAVRDYLVQAGIDAARLTSRGYGETRPIESNRTRAGRSSNRRVEFLRTDANAAAAEGSAPASPAPGATDQAVP
jgi:outer membrane protein OmpA-like peptidoglycan-associated protein